MRGVVVSAILGTDMAKHFKMLTKFKALISPGTANHLADTTVSYADHAHACALVPPPFNP